MFPATPNQQHLSASHLALQALMKILPLLSLHWSMQDSGLSAHNIKDPFYDVFVDHQSVYSLQKTHIRHPAILSFVQPEMKLILR